MQTYAAIPTTYKGVNMRSRLEATWAAFFDLLGVEWQYEPVDLQGYIPDFIISLGPLSKITGPVLVEIKGAVSVEELHPHKKKIDESGWEGWAMIWGCNLDISLERKWVQDPKLSWWVKGANLAGLAPTWAQAKNATQWRGRP